MTNEHDTHAQPNAQTETTLDQKWGNSQVVISLETAKRILKAFKQEGIKNGDTLLIFDDDTFHKYRKVGEQYEYSYVFKGKKKSTFSLKQGATA